VFITLGLALAACQRLEQVSGRVWRDSNADGVKDDDESWLEGVQVDLFSLKDGRASRLESAQTDESGHYALDVGDEADPTQLEIRVTALDGMAFTIANQAPGESIGNDVDQAGYSGVLADYSRGDAAEVNAGLMGTVPGHAADRLGDAVDCERTLSLTGQELPQHADITQVSWVGAGDQIMFEIRMAADNLPALELDEGDFIGLGVEYLDPQGMLTSDVSSGWVPDRMGNLSMNIIRNPVDGTFFGSRFEVRAGRWTEVPGVIYPVEMTSDSFVMTVPLDDIPAGARGFVTAIVFDADLSEIFCDLAAIDEENLSDETSSTPEIPLVRTAFNVIAGRESIADLPYRLVSPNG
jgi:hypothetical protein